jgi:hypothetical protein
MRTFLIALHSVARAMAMRGTLCQSATPNWLIVRFFSPQRASGIHKECTKHLPASGNLSASFVYSRCSLWLRSGVTTKCSASNRAFGSRETRLMAGPGKPIAARGAKRGKIVDGGPAPAMTVLGNALASSGPLSSMPYAWLTILPPHMRPAKPDMP